MSALPNPSSLAGAADALGGDLGAALGNALGALNSRLDFSALLDDNDRLLQVRTALPALAFLPEHLPGQDRDPDHRGRLCRLPGRAVALGRQRVTTTLDLGDVPTFERYDGAGGYRYQDGDGADHAVSLALAAAELHLNSETAQLMGSATLKRSTPAFFLLLAATALPALATAAGASVQACLRIIETGHPLVTQSLFEDDDRIYFAFSGVEFGEFKAGGAFIAAGGTTARLSAYRFRMPDGSTRTLSSDQFAMMRGELYAGTIGRRRILCIAAPLSGVGSSGRFQRYLAVFQFRSDKPVDGPAGLSAAIVKDPHADRL